MRRGRERIGSHEFCVDSSTRGEGVSPSREGSGGGGPNSSSEVRRRKWESERVNISQMAVVLEPNGNA